MAWWAGDKNSVQDCCELQSSKLITFPLQNHIGEQDRVYGYDIVEKKLQNKAVTNRQNRERSVMEAGGLYSQLPYSLQRAVDLSRLPGRGVPPLGSLLFPSKIMALPCIDLTSMMP